MAQANFAYTSPANEPAGLSLSVSVYADRAHLRDLMRDDAAAAGLRIADVGDLARLLDSEARALARWCWSIARRSTQRGWRRWPGSICAPPTPGRSWWSQPRSPRSTMYLVASTSRARRYWSAAP